MEDDKRQPTLALCLGELTPLCLSIFQHLLLFNILGGTVQTFLPAALL